MNKPSILIVDDDESIRELFDDALSSCGYDIYHAYDGIDTVKAMKTLQPDLLVLDLKMPRMDGLAFLQHARAAGFTNPILVVSGLSAPEIADKVLALGGDHFCLKPVNIEKFLGIIDKLLSTPPPQSKNSG